jgi:hypothetical protein
LSVPEIFVEDVICRGGTSEERIIAESSSRRAERVIFRCQFPVDPFAGS